MPDSINRSFYSSLLKHNFSLDAREELSALLNRVSIQQNHSLWSKISSYSSRYSKEIVSLRRNGWLILKSPVFQQVATDISKYADDHSLMDASKSVNPVRYIRNISDIPSVHNLLSLPELYSLVSLYIGGPALVYNVAAWIQYPGFTDKQPNTQLWHRDRDDFSFLKMFMNVGDVTHECGPHAFIPGSHSSVQLKDLFVTDDSYKLKIINGQNHKFLSDDSLMALGLVKKPKIWNGPSGLTFLEDTRGFHRAYIPLTTPRLMFSITWTVGHGFSPDNLLGLNDDLLKAL